MIEASQQLHKFHGGLQLESHKSISCQRAIAPMPPQQQYVVPLQQHIGEESELLVKTGDRVLKGEMLAKPMHLISAPVHAPVSGTVTDIGKYPIPHPSGLTATCVVITNDFAERWIEREPVGDRYNQMSSHELRTIVRDAGIVGLGGAVFPTAVKQTEIGIETLIINGVECEPYITCDDMLMREHAREVVAGADIIGHIIKARECIIAIEDNKPEAIAAIQKIIDEDGTGYFSIARVPTIYPSGGEKQLIQVLTGKEVPMNNLPADIDVLCQNVGTAYAIYRAIYEAEPLISRIVTVTGNGVGQPQNLEVLLGTRMQACIEHCGGYSDDASCLIMGGPMMGYTVDNDLLPVVKASNCLLVSTADEIHPANMSSHLPCIRCSRCVEVCPAQLLPQQLYWYASARNFERVVEYHLFDCIECGCCSYVCPSQIPLVQYYRFAKSEIWTQEYEHKKSSIARERHEFHEARLERQKREREERLRKKKEMLNKKKGKPDKDDIDVKKDAIAEALARVQKKKEEQHIEPKNTENLTAEQQAQIEDADRRRRLHEQAATSRTNKEE